MATPRSQRIGIWIIAIVMIVGTIGSFLVLILANNNAQVDQQNQAKKYADFQKQQQQLAEENAAKSQPLDGYVADTFDASKVTTLQRTILKEGTGQVVKATDTINASYFGWLPSGRIFDSSKKSGKNTPVDLSLKGVIPGWTEGLAGEKEGAVVKLIIPADKAYASQASGIIPANTPLSFIVEINKIANPPSKTK